MLLLFGILVFFPFHGTVAAPTCNTITSIKNTWQQGQDSKFTLFVPATTDEWTIVIIFDKPITTFNSWNGILFDCVNGTFCSFTNQFYNAKQTKGASLELLYQILFTPTAVPPKVSYFTFNGILICSDGNVVPPVPAPFSLPKIFGDGMVLQAAPDRAQVWGYLGGVTLSVTINIKCLSGYARQYTALNDVDKWSVILDPVREGDNCEIHANQAGKAELVIRDILFGDVWVCSGQSNMEWPMGLTFNSTREITEMASFKKIRLFHPSQQQSKKPEDDLINPGYPELWSNTSDANAVGSFSAICMLYAKYLTQKLGNKAFGLVESAVGGTGIESWSTLQGLTDCHIPPYSDPRSPIYSNSLVYNAMIHPLHKFTIKGVIWYQGEGNAGNKGQDSYSCTFPALINEWRRKWSQNSPTNSTFPFGFVQLAAFREGLRDTSFTQIRWHQTLDLGYVPNSILKNAFMAVSLDTFDEYYGIHPRNKQLVSKRLATSAMNMVYGYKEYPVSGPFPKYVQFIQKAAENTAVIVFDQPISFNVVEFAGFYNCFQTDYNLCDSQNSWLKVNGSIVFDPAQNYKVVVSFSSCAIGFAYLWSETPVLGTEALPIYSKDVYRLPAAPWKSRVNF